MDSLIEEVVRRIAQLSQRRVEHFAIAAIAYFQRYLLGAKPFAKISGEVAARYESL